MRNWLRKLLNLPDPEVPLYGPQGVSVTYRDGMTFENVPSIYTGHDPDDGCAVYELIPPRDPAVDLPVHLGIETMPAKTAIVFPFSGIPKSDFGTIEKEDFGG